MRGADVERLDVKSAPAEKTGDARQNAKTVFDQDCDGMTHSPPSKENAAARSRSDSSPPVTKRKTGADLVDQRLLPRRRMNETYKGIDPPEGRSFKEIVTIFDAPY